MTKRQRILIIGTIIILVQIVLFRNYLPFISNKLIIDGQSCTCPHAKVTNGRSFLETITPDSLRKYNLDYSEIYFENEISTSSDPIGVNQYIISGQIIGKESISEGDGHYYPLFRIDNYNWTILYNYINWFIIGLLLIEIFILFRMVKRKRNDA
jgi:hypothetical protein